MAADALPRLRDAEPGDEAVVAEFIRVLSATVDYESPIAPEDVSRYLAHDSAHALLAELDGVTVGLLTYGIYPGLSHLGSWGLIAELIVRPEAQRRGVADALVTEALRRLAAAGCRGAVVSVVPDNESANALYRKHGFGDESLQLEKYFDRAPRRTPSR